ncbi:MAG: M23 family metallopeptidase [Bacteroidota bacterium]|nr:M23 family metallopeptidase [Bacteroidota bacterium]
MNNSKDQKFLKKFKNKYRFVVLTEDKLEEKTSFRLSRFNVIMIISIFIFIITTIIFLLIAFTSIKEYIPGYADFRTREVLREQINRTDSLELVLQRKEKYFNNIIKILNGDVDDYTKQHYKKENVITASDKIKLFNKTKEDSILRIQFEKDSQYNVYFQEDNKVIKKLQNLMFFPPVKGVVTQKFDLAKGHPAVDIASSKNVGIKATLDGTVIFSGWNVKTGNILIIQHSNNLISVYKHNSVLLKTMGDFVNAGDVIALIGESGELSEGIHLHFELWYNGNPLNPEDYLFL